jgi:alpha-L-rhamnosidase
LNEFDLGARNNFKTVKWNDITARLESGKSYVFGLVGRNEGPSENPAGVIGLLTLEFTTGEPMVIRTGEGWKVSKTFEAGWNAPAFDDSRWAAAKVIGPANMQPWGEPRSAEDRRLPARWLRKEFAVEKRVSRATVYFSGLGSSELYLNGAKVGDAVLSPALAQYDKRAFYVTYDVTKQLRRGGNAIGAVLGGGRFSSDRSKVYAGTVNSGWPKMILQLRLECVRTDRQALGTSDEPDPCPGNPASDFSQGSKTWRADLRHGPEYGGLVPIESSRTGRQDRATAVC